MPSTPRYKFPLPSTPPVGSLQDSFDRMGDMLLSTDIVSEQDGPRMAGVSNFGGKKAQPFVKGGGRRAKAAVAKALARKARAK